MWRPRSGLGYRALGQSQAGGDGGEPLVARPQSCTCRQQGRGQHLRVPVSDAESEQVLVLDQGQHFCVGRGWSVRDVLKESDDFAAARQLAQSELAYPLGGTAPDRRGEVRRALSRRYVGGRSRRRCLPESRRCRVPSPDCGYARLGACKLSKAPPEQRGFARVSATPRWLQSARIDHKPRGCGPVPPVSSR